MTQTRPIQVTLRGDVADSAGERARTKVAKALAVVTGRVLSAEVVLDWLPDPAVERHAIAEATVRVDGRSVRAKASAATMPAAVDELESRLRSRLVRQQDRNRSLHRRPEEQPEHEWRHGGLPSQRAPYVPRPPETREVVRRKSFAASPMSVEEAVGQMDMLDHDFFLFTEVHSGSPAVVHTRENGTVGVQCRSIVWTQWDPPAGFLPEPPAPRMNDAEARERLVASGAPFLFYLDASGETAHVLYHRYDGNYGLITLT